MLARTLRTLLMRYFFPGNSKSWKQSKKPKRQPWLKQKRLRLRLLRPWRVSLGVVQSAGTLETLVEAHLIRKTQVGVM